jgi:hypothetical protein
MSIETIYADYSNMSSYLDSYRCKQGYKIAIISLMNNSVFHSLENGYVFSEECLCCFGKIKKCYDSNFMDIEDSYVVICNECARFINDKAKEIREEEIERKFLIANIDIIPDIRDYIYDYVYLLLCEN